MAADHTTPHITPGTEAQMVESARRGDLDSFALVYRQEAPLAWRLAVAITRSPSTARKAVAEGFAKVLAGTPTSTPFSGDLSAQLLAATRAAAIDGSAASEPLRPVPTTSGGGSLGTEAFHGLPERWRSVLWLTAVEHLEPSVAATVLGSDPHSVGELAIRAGHGLRERFSLAHMAVAGTPDCGRTARRLDDYAAEELSIREARRVRDHLDTCEACRERLAELDDLIPRLSHAAPPLPSDLPDDAETAWRAASVVAAGPLHIKLPNGRHVPAWAERAAAGVAAAVITVGITGAIIAGGRGKPRTDRLARDAASEESLSGADGENALGSIGDLPLVLPDGTPVPTFGGLGGRAATGGSSTGAGATSETPRSSASSSPLPSTTPSTSAPTTTTTSPTPTTQPSAPSAPTTTTPPPVGGDSTTDPVPAPEPIAPITEVVEDTVDQVVDVVLDPLLSGGSTGDSGSLTGAVGGLLGG